MLSIYEVENKKLINTDIIKKRSWIDLINPTSDEINTVVENTKIEKEIFIKLLDEPLTLWLKNFDI